MLICVLPFHSAHHTVGVTAFPTTMHCGSFGSGVSPPTVSPVPTVKSISPGACPEAGSAVPMSGATLTKYPTASLTGSHARHSAELPLLKGHWLAAVALEVLGMNCTGHGMVKDAGCDHGPRSLS